MNYSDRAFAGTFHGEVRTYVQDTQRTRFRWIAVTRGEREFRDARVQRQEGDQVAVGEVGFEKLEMAKMYVV